MLNFFHVYTLSNDRDYYMDTLYQTETPVSVRGPIPYPTLLVMPPTLKKLKGHIGFGLSVRARVRLCVHSRHFLMHAIL